MHNDTTTGGARSGDRESKVTVGLDLSDRYSSWCVLDEDGALVEEGRVQTTVAALSRRFGTTAPCRIVLEVGTHSPWASRLLAELGHEVIVANPRKVRLIAESDRKHDRLDAELLARLGRHDPRLLAPIRHRGEQAQEDLTFVRSRDTLVRARTALINHVRGTVKAHGARLPLCSAPAFHRKVAEHIPEGLRRALTPHLDIIEQLSRQIAACDRWVGELCADRYPDTKLLRQVTGVGPLTALTYVLAIEDPHRFRRSREVGLTWGSLRASGSPAPAHPNCTSPRRAIATYANSW